MMYLCSMVSELSNYDWWQFLFIDARFILVGGKLMSGYSRN